MQGAEARPFLNLVAHPGVHRHRLPLPFCPKARVWRGEEQKALCGVDWLLGVAQPGSQAPLSFLECPGGGKEGAWAWQGVWVSAWLAGKERGRLNEVCPPAVLAEKGRCIIVHVFWERGGLFLL